MRILLGVSGGIAAYKAVLLLRLLREAGHQVRVIPTKAALKFVGKATWEALSGEPVSRSVFHDVPGVEHVALGQGADLIIVAPATADLLARAACGRADDLLTASLLTAHCPVVMAPAMHTEMWLHPATQANVATLRARGVHVIDPDSGRLTGADSGPGRLPDPERIATEALALVGAELPPKSASLSEPTSASAATSPSYCDCEAGRRIQTGPSLPLAGRRVVITAGGTREPIDPVRWIGNRSSGKQGIALARAAQAAGADVTLIAANVEHELLAPITGVHVVEVESTADMAAALASVAPDADLIIMAAAIADFRPADVADAKIKKSGTDGPPTIQLVENPDLLAGLVRDRRPGQVIVGFAAETGDANGSVLDHGRTKAQRKGADLLAVNAVGEQLGFGTADNEVWLLDATGREAGHAAGTKAEVAEAIIAAATALLVEN